MPQTRHKGHVRLEGVMLFPVVDFFIVGTESGVVDLKA